VQEMDRAARPRRFGEPLRNGALEAGMVVGDHELDTVQSAGFQADEKIFPAASAFPVRQLDPNRERLQSNGQTSGRTRPFLVTGTFLVRCRLSRRKRTFSSVTNCGRSNGPLTIGSISRYPSGRPGVLL
jgi:hypothetical protein